MGSRLTKVFPCDSARAEGKEPAISRQVSEDLSVKTSGVSGSLPDPTFPLQLGRGPLIKPLNYALQWGCALLALLCCIAEVVLFQEQME